MSPVHNLRVRLPFLNRSEELARIGAALDAVGPSLCVLYGRRRLGKSRLVLEALAQRRAVYFVGDDRDASLQRRALAREIERLLPGFATVEYPDWSALLERFSAQAPPDAVLALDEFPALAARSRELPSVLQRLVDGQHGPHLILTGSAQQMMHGLVLDGSAPLFGRAREVLRIDPLAIRYLPHALSTSSSVAAVEHWATWGGVPRYWELAREHRSRSDAVRHLVLSPLGVLFREPERLLRDDLEDVGRAASLLALVGMGAHRLSEIASRLGHPATSLSRPLRRGSRPHLCSTHSCCFTPRGARCPRRTTSRRAFQFAGRAAARVLARSRRRASARRRR
jgi:AAA+ ATPase superfamily predicted ATPase